MPLWHCPHCGTPQPEASRCWVCRKSSTSCATCRHFRRGIAGQLGYCGLDRRRSPLGGGELRPCWEAAVTTPIGIGARTAEARTAPREPLAWLEVGGPLPPVVAHARAAAADDAAEPHERPATGPSWPERTPDGLWGELEG